MNLLFCLLISISGATEIVSTPLQNVYNTFLQLRVYRIS
jgi:hypothetical protein